MNKFTAQLGNDAVIRVSFYDTEGQIDVEGNIPYDLSKAQDIVVEMVNQFRKRTKMAYKIEAPNVLVIELPVEQQKLGNYFLEVLFQVPNPDLADGLQAYRLRLDGVSIVEAGAMSGQVGATFGVVDPNTPTRAALLAQIETLTTERDNAKEAQVQAEEGKTTAETERDQAVRDKTAADEAKAQAEQERDQARQDKTAADEAKAQAEQERDTAKEAQAQAEEGKAQAEQERDTAKEAQATAERDKTQAEAERDQAVRDKTAADEAKAQAEQERDTAKEAQATAERDKTQAEAEREQALQDKATAEGERDQALQDKATAETERDEANRAKATAETERDQTLQDKANLEQVLSGYLRRVLIDPSVTSVPSGQFAGREDIEVVILENCKSIGYRAFADCKRLKMVIAPSLTSVEYSAFRDSAISSLTVSPDAIYGISGQAYEYGLAGAVIVGGDQRQYIAPIDVPGGNDIVGGGDFEMP